MIELNNIYSGDCLEVLKTLPDESVDCVMTSPPYWALRNYGIIGEIGSEQTIQEYITNLCNIFDEVKRVLKKEGTCWVNLGDTYYGSGTGKHGYAPENMATMKSKGTLGDELVSKSLCQIPSRFAIEMSNRGWILRNEIIWHKPNAMPSSVKDRFTVDFEKMFFFTKNKKYYFETQREPHNPDSIKRAARGRTSAKLDDGQYSTSYKSKYVGYDNLKEDFESGKLRGVHPEGRNKRTVWKISTKGFKDAHFAVYPEELCYTPIKAGCPEGGVVLDPFFGAGTTGVVALKQKKHFIGIELNEKYIKIAWNRIIDISKEIIKNGYEE